MKIARFVLKIVGWALALAAAICCVVAYWDKLTSGFRCLKDRLSEKGPCCCRPSEYDDYADWDE